VMAEFIIDPPGMSFARKQRKANSIACRDV
jgi:hypothetical protein